MKFSGCLLVCGAFTLPVFGCAVEQVPDADIGADEAALTREVMVVDDPVSPITCKAPIASPSATDVNGGTSKVGNACYKGVTCPDSGCKLDGHGEECKWIDSGGIHKCAGSCKGNSTAKCVPK